jgi:arabinogalactan oligomer / maltooligosaccharide transport system substrate-binding protein
MRRVHLEGALCVLACVLAAACSGGPAPGGALRLWHTFSPEETAALNDALQVIEREGNRRVAASVLPYGRALNRYRDAFVRGGADCPDLARIDATWLPDLAQAGLLVPPPDTATTGFSPEAMELAEWQGRRWALPQTVDGLALLYDAAAVRDAGIPWPPATLADLEGAARALARGGRYGLSVRADAYWFIAFLRAAGGDILDPATHALGIDRPEAEAALARYAALVAPGGVAPRPEAAGDEAARELRRFAAGEIALLVAGPWAVPALSRTPGLTLADPGGCAGFVPTGGSRCLELGVAPYPRAPDGRPAAPRGGHLYVVPRCARRPGEAWRLAARLTAPELQAAWSRLGLIPTRTSAIDAAAPIARAFAASLAATRPLPRDPITPLLFDDLTPAVAAVLAGDATPREALDGVTRAWSRIVTEGAGR